MIRQLFGIKKTSLVAVIIVISAVLLSNCEGCHTAEASDVIKCDLSDIVIYEQKPYVCIILANPKKETYCAHIGHGEGEKFAKGISLKSQLDAARAMDKRVSIEFQLIEDKLSSWDIMTAKLTVL